ncbi:DSC-2 [Biomphalaria pfeifferi]|uniref:DSC-2 n=1 Tax=Biomphalaria pfeifferi TaxID=112525 RepID=A0AAD8C3B1_BIOPF|nr:DSC-2 [Biomphalaria pfeifferi]
MEMRTIFSALYAMLNFIISTGYASQLLFHTNEPVIHPILTKTLRLRCSVRNDANSIDVLRPLPAAPTESPNDREERQLHSNNMPSVNSELMASENVSQTTYVSSGNTTHSTFDLSPQADIAHVMSIIVSKELSGKYLPLAKVTPYDPAFASTWIDNDVKVQGNCETSPVPGEQSFLELTWISPKEEQAGHFKCDIYALNTDSLAVSLSTSLDITSSAPTFSDLISYVTDHDKIISEKEAEISRLNNETQSLKSALDELKINTTNEIRDLKDNLVDMLSPNIESGIIRCPLKEFISFQKTYRVDPLVFSSFVNATSNGNGYNRIGFYIDITNVTTTGFSVDCGYSYNECVPTFKWSSTGYYK